ncbi:MAG: hypothetical protein ACJ747_00305 [Gaiellaceae bacterium]|jgi:hypothetical protein
MTTVTSRARPARDRTLADRFLGVVPLLAIFFWLCAIYAWQAWRHGSPWLFGDELELSQLSRAIAETGHAARRGQPHSFDTLYTYVIAPAWKLHSTQHAYDAVKYLNVILMTAVAFPAYGIARHVSGKIPALFAAAAAAVIPALFYTSLIVEEPLAYPYSTLCLFLIIKALTRRTRWWIVGAVLVSIVAPAVRGELIVIPATFMLALMFRLWQTEPSMRWRRTWSAADWVGGAVVVAGAAIVLSAIFGHRSQEWVIATGFYKHRMFTYGLRAAGALTIGLGVLPVVVGLATLWRVPGERYRVELRTFRCVVLAAVITFGMYTAVKASYLSTTFGTVTVERNLVYLAPLFFAATALWLERRALHPVAVAVASAFALYLILTTPYEMQFRLYSDAPGFALLEWLNRTALALTPGGAKVLLLVVLVAVVAVLVGTRYVPRAAPALAIAVAAFVLAWNGAGQLTASAASNAFSRSSLSNIHGGPEWLDGKTNGAPTFYLGQGIQDPNSVNLLEFWNRSVKQVWSLDGTAPGPGPTLTPDLARTNGTLFPDPKYEYAVAEPGIVFAGTPLAHHEHRAGGRFQRWTLYRVSHPLRLKRSITGLYPDGWSGPNGTQYTQYTTPGGGTGTIAIRVSRQDWSGPFTPANVQVTMGGVRIGTDKQPHLALPYTIRKWRIRRNESKTFVLHTPGPRFRVEVAVAPFFRPHDLAPERTSDARPLGAEVSYRFTRSRRTRR